MRRVTSPSRGSMKYVASFHSPSGKFDSGPRSTRCLNCLPNAGPSAITSGGTETIAPITPPSPSVAPSRKRLRGNRSPGSGAGIAASPAVAGIAGARPSAGAGGRSGSTCSGTPRYSIVASRAQRKPNTIAIAPPIGATKVGLTISPTSTQAMPAANPTGYSDGAGRCGRPSCRGSIRPPPPCGSPTWIQPPPSSACQRRNKRCNGPEL